MLCNSGCVFAHPQTAAHSCKRPPWSSLWRPDHEDRTPARCHRHCHCTQAGRSGEPQEHIQHENTCKQTSLSPNTQPYTYPTNTDTNNLPVYVASCTDKRPLTLETEQECRWCMFVLKQPVKDCTNLMINDCVCYPSFPLPIHHFPLSLRPSVPLFSPSPANSKYLSGGLPRVYAVLDVSNPGVLLQRVDGFQDVLSPVFHLWKQPNTAITH